jgi:hypothetical protein
MKLGRLVGALAVTVAFVGVGIAPASAYTCNSGMMCLWKDRSYSGTIIGRSGTVGSLGGTALDNAASSAATNGKSCRKTWWAGGYTNPTWDAYGFALWSEQLTGSNYRDPNLSNGAGFYEDAPRGYNQNMEDYISSWQFIDC